MDVFGVALAAGRELFRDAVIDAAYELGVLDGNTRGNHRLRALVDVLVAAGLEKSRGDAWRDIERDGVSVDGVRAKDPKAEIGAGTYVVRVGKNRFARVIVTA